MKGRLATAQVLASGEEWFVLASSRIVLSVCRIIVAAVPWFWWLREPVSCGWAVHTGGDRRRLLASCCAGACEWRGAVRTGILPDSSVGLPANPRSRAVVLVGCGSQLAVGGLCTQEATAGDCWLPAARVLASGEERFVQASSRIVLSVCRLILAAVPWFWWVAGAS